MNQSSTAGPCVPSLAEQYLDDRLPTEGSRAFEAHMDDCQLCRDHLLQAAGSRRDWQWIRSSLDDDPYDVEREAAHSTDTSVTDELLRREIQGWLDPTDDPNMLGRFGGYEIAGILGHGGMGIVLKGFEPRLNRYVAIKVLAPRLASSGTAKKRFQREAEAAAAILHDNVIAIHRVDEAHGLPFLVMPFVHGETLQQRLRKQGPLTPKTTLRIASQILAGLSAAHSQGLIHRDIKPANILLGLGTDRVTITDFGLARAAGDSGMTKTGVIAGTPPYMSPEQAVGDSVDSRSDLFSVGSVMYAMLTGKPPFGEDDVVQILERIGEQRVTSIRQFDASLPRWLERLVNHLLETSPQDRPANADLAKQWIDTCLLHLNDEANPLPKALIRGQTRPWLFTGAAITSLFAALIGGWIVGNVSNTAPVQKVKSQGNHIPPESIREIQSELQDIEAEIDSIEQDSRFLFRKDLSP